MFLVFFSPFTENSISGNDWKSIFLSKKKRWNICTDFDVFCVYSQCIYEKKCWENFVKVKDLSKEDVSRQLV